MSWRREIAGTLGAVANATPVRGGDINDAFRVQLSGDRTVFVKVARGAQPAETFRAEADGLRWLAEAGAGSVRIADVLAVGETWLALAWIEPGVRGPRFAEELGRGLAHTHAAGAPAFGHVRDTWLATLPQPAVACADVRELWIEHRLRPACRRAAAIGHAPSLDAALDALRARDDRFGPAEPPARVHGDLWWGNVVVAADGAPVAVDPAVYGGHREIDLAMLALFGELPDALVGAYEEVAPLSQGWRERIALWQLYPLAVHAVLFGGGYGARLARTIRALL